MEETKAPAAGEAARDEGYSNVSDAVAELERREKERARARKAAATRKANAEQDDAAEPDEDAPASPKAKRAGKDAQIEQATADKPKQKAKAEPEDDGNADDDESDDAEDDDGEGDATDEADDDLKAADEDAEDDEQAEPEPKKKEKPPTKIKLRVGDRDVEATPDEVSEYVRQAESERGRTQQAHQALQQHFVQLQQHGQALAHLAQALIGNAPDAALAYSDPNTYTAQKAAHEHRALALQQVQNHLQRAAQAAQVQQQQAFAQGVERERAALLRAMPDLADPQKLASFQGRVQKVAQRYGFSPQELQQSFDHRTYLMWRDLGRLADMEVERSAVRKKLKGAPPLKTPEQRAGAGQRNVAEQRSRDAKRAFLSSDRSMRSVRAFLDATDRR